MKKDGRLQLRVSSKLTSQAKKIAKKRGTTLTALIEEYLVTLIAREERSKDAEQF
jgi:predicted HicB family RNase H-like nuclease